MRLETTVAAALLTCALASPVAAQDKRFAITIGYPTAAGVKWQVLERLALRSEFTVGYSNEVSQDITLSAGTWTFGVATSAVMSIARDGPRHLYAAPYYEFQRRSTTLSPTSLNSNIEVKPRSHDHSIGGVVGFEFLLNDRYGVFAEGGAAYLHSKRTTTTPANSPPLILPDEIFNVTVEDVRAIGRVGVNIYF